MRLNELFEGKSAGDLLSNTFTSKVSRLAQKFGLEYDGTKHNALFVKFGDASQTEAFDFVRSERLEALVKEFGYTVADNNVDSRYRKEADDFSIELKPTKQVSEAKMVGDDSHPFSVKILKKGPGRWPTLKGEIYEKDVLIGTFARKAVDDGWIPPITYKFRTERARDRFDDFADSLSIEETIEALMP